MFRDRKRAAGEVAAPRCAPLALRRARRERLLGVRRGPNQVRLLGGRRGPNQVRHRVLIDLDEGCAEPRLFLRKKKP